MKTRRRDPTLKARSRSLRRELTPAEKILWPILRGRRFAGFKCRRQHLLEPYILDYYCAAAKLVLELDGETHLTEDDQRRDERRTKWLESQEIKVLRFWNTQVFDELESVLEFVWRECKARAAVFEARRRESPKQPSAKA